MKSLSFQETLDAICSLWKKTYIGLLPFSVLVTFCFNSSLLLDNIIIAVLLTLPGLYLSNIILLKLAAVFRQEYIIEEKFYSLAFARFPNSLMLFLGLAGVFLILFIAVSSLAGIIAGLFCALMLLIIYSYFLFSYPLVVIDNIAPREAIKKSFYLINNHMWYITGIFIVAGLVQAVVYVLLFFIVGLRLSSLIYNIIFTSFNFAILVVVMESLKAKKNDA
jgi:hypothetical protein